MVAAQHFYAKKINKYTVHSTQHKVQNSTLHKIHCTKYKVQYSTQSQYLVHREQYQDKVHSTRCTVDSAQ